MKAKKVWILIVVALVAIFGGRAWYLNKNKTEDTNTIKIGAILPLSGSMSHNGEMALNALKTLEENHNNTSNLKIQIVAEDGKFTAKDSISAFRKLQSQGIDLILSYGDVPSKPIALIAKEQELPIFAVANADDLNQILTVINLIPSNAYMMEKTADFIISDIKPKKLAIITQKEPVAVDKGNYVANKSKNANIEITTQEQYSFEATEVRSIVSKVLIGNPDSVLVLGWGPAYVAVLNTLREQGFKGAIITDWNISAIFASLAKSEYPLYWMDTYFDENSSIPAIKDFVDTYKRKYQMSPDIFAMLTYVGGEVISDAISSQNYNVKEIMKQSQNIHNLQTILGKVDISQDRFIRVPLVIKQMQVDGTAKIVKE